MSRLLTKYVVSPAVVFLLCLTINPAQALGPFVAAENIVVRPIIGNCEGQVGMPFLFGGGNFFSGARILNPSNFQGNIAGGFYFRADGTLAIAGGSILTIEDFLAVECGLTEITNVFEDGPDGTFDTDDYAGFRFTAIEPSDGLLYDYEVALSGLTDTELIVTRTRNTGPEPEPPVNSPSVIPSLPFWAMLSLSLFIAFAALKRMAGKQSV